ncbi:PREDICTED: solute carrier family 35 member F6 isoform X2 [Ceratosolen solmsi marchali]|uniref:Solute carrier family 35 member F6 isoform X2 n=1 Tax=Ceratosolen solmsi marchali TaxID=326594 RepID=A0AAJ7E128_9HYME|nr:PREDICTED: solute carrier family 35 member F6 isoform X2 [Ceratosolen solmsi marchali]
MAWTYYQRALAMIMIITGSFNTLCVKYADQQIVPGQDGQLRHFNHPYMQSLFMFIGEMICLLVFKIIFCYYTRLRNGYEDRSNLTKGSRTFNPLVLIIPAACDVVATSINYIGLNMTYASSFQMLRGAVIVFTGILSVGFLNKKLNRREWLGITFVIFGLLLVGLSDFITMQNQKIITAVQMVVEEKYTTGQDIPALQVVGWEGVYGFIGICLIMIPLNFIYVIPPFADNSRGTLEATIDAFIQIANCDRLLMAIIGIIFSIAFFNFAGISVTKELNATTRMILDSIRTIVIWIFSLTLQWQTFHYLQLIGFFIIFIGMSCYNNIVIPQLIKKCQCRLRHLNFSVDEEQVINTAADYLEETH